MVHLRIGLLALSAVYHARAFSVRPPLGRPTSPSRCYLPSSSTRPSASSSARGTDTRLFVFDFLRQRSQEGLQQLSNLAEATARGRLGEGLAEAAAYTSSTNRAFAQGLAKSRGQLLANLDALFASNLAGAFGGAGGAASQEEMLQELEDVLLMADLGTTTARDIIEEVQSLCQQPTTADGAAPVALQRDDLMSVLRGKLIETLTVEDTVTNNRTLNGAASAPVIWFIMGSNGMGKTTTVGKLSHRLRTGGIDGQATDGDGEDKLRPEVDGASDSSDGVAGVDATLSPPAFRVLLAACDTFRAGAVDQLQHWADRARVDLVGPTDQAKTPSAILANALDKAIDEQYDVLIVDTSGRLSSNYELTEELAEMKQLIQKRMAVETDAKGKPVLNTRVPHETLLVLDAAQGRMALDSAKIWNEEIGLTGLIVTKLDGTARGGSVVAISRDLNLPVKLIGVGEGIEDLRDFEPERFVDSLLGIGQFGGSGSKKNEGDFLAARLAELRQQRDSRAKLKKQLEPVGNVKIPAPTGASIPNSMAPSFEFDYSSPKSNRRKTKKKKGKR